MQKIKRIIVAVVGGTVLAVGIALMVLPGPAFIVIPAGLAILAMEFAWARRWLGKARTLLRKNGPTGAAGDGGRPSVPRTIQTPAKQTVTGAGAGWSRLRPKGPNQ